MIPKNKILSKLDNGEIDYLNFHFMGFSICGFFEKNKITEKILSELIKKFLTTNPVLYEPSSNMKCETYEINFNNSLIVFISAKDPKTKYPTVLCGDKRTLVQCGVIKQELIFDGQHRKKLG